MSSAPPPPGCLSVEGFVGGLVTAGCLGAVALLAAGFALGWFFA